MTQVKVTSFSWTVQGTPLLICRPLPGLLFKQPWESEQVLGLGSSDAVDWQGSVEGRILGRLWVLLPLLDASLVLNWTMRKLSVRADLEGSDIHNVQSTPVTCFLCRSGTSPLRVWAESGKRDRLWLALHPEWNSSDVCHQGLWDSQESPLVHFLGSET